MFFSNCRSNVAVVALLLSAWHPSVSFAQDSNAPIFSTPASRSGTAVPILTDPTGQDNDKILDSAGGGSRKAGNSAQKNRQATTAASEAVETAAAPTDTQAFGDWQKQCLKAPKTKEVRCQIVGSVLSPDAKQVILVLSAALVKGKGELGMQMAVPLGVALKNGVKLTVGTSYEQALPVSRCTPQGCLVEASMPPEMIEAMKSASSAVVAVDTPDGKVVPISLSLKGFSDAHAALLKTN